MYCGRCTPVESEDACSISGADLKDLVERMGSWCTMLREVRETICLSITNSIQKQHLTFEEKCMSLIIRFLLHLSS